MELCSGASSLTTASLSPPQVVKSRDGFVKTRDAFLYCNGEWAVLGNVHIQMMNRFSSMVSNYISQIISRDVYEIKPHIAELLENSRQTKCWEQEMMKLLVSSRRQRNWKDEMTLFCGLLPVGEVTRDAKDLLIENYHDLVQETIIWWHLWKIMQGKE